MSYCLSSRNGVRTRKNRRCELCGEVIPKGTLRDIRTGVCDGGFWTMNMHPECHAYEQQPGTVDPDWYYDAMYPAFDRADALKFVEDVP